MKLNGHNIVIEYDGGGHELDKVYKSDEYYERHEKERQDYILSQGYKMIRLISHTDKLPSDEDIIRIVNEGVDYLNNGHNLYKYDLDKMQQIE